MNRQFTKLLIILNACFWLAVSFAVWKYTTNFPQQVVSNVIVLGSASIVANVLFWLSFFLQKKEGRRINNWVHFAFILGSTLAQAFLIFFLLQ
jgi:hypothetical protein